MNKIFFLLIWVPFLTQGMDYSEFKAMAKRENSIIIEAPIEIPYYNVYYPNNDMDTVYTAGSFYIRTQTVMEDGGVEHVKTKRIKQSSSELLSSNLLYQRVPYPIESYPDEYLISYSNPTLRVDVVAQQEKKQQEQERKQLSNFHQFLKNK